MIIKNAYILLITICCTAHVLAAGAVLPDKELQQLLQLDLEELPKISVASKREETIQEAPGIITVVTSDEIRKFGYRNLRDILDRQTHMQVIGSNLFPHNRVSLRGIAFTHTDNVVLPLINGRPLREATSVNTDHDFYESFPVEAIEQIEIIRGPGSVLYGTNAFAGAINIITKNAPGSPAGSASVSYGSFDNKKGTFNGGGRFGDLEVYAALNAFDIDGDDFKNITDELGNTGTYKTGISGASFILNGKFRGLTLNTMISDTSRNHARSTFVLPSTEMDVERQFIDLGYVYDLTDNWNISANVSYYHFRDRFLLGTTGDQLGDANNWLAEVTSQAKITDKLSFLAGGTYNLQDGTIKTGDLDYNSINLNAYAQFDYWLLDWLKIIGGVQYNKPDDVSGDFSPRVAAIANITDQWGIKLLYGKAFRQASPIERFIIAPAVVGNPRLEPETIDTFDAQLFFNGKHGSFAITYFHSKQKDLISRTGLLPQQFINSGEVTYDGFEFEGKLKLGHGFNFIGNLSYQTNENSNGMDDVTYSPDWMAKTGLSYENERGISLGIFNSYFTESTLQNIDLNPAVAIVNPEADGYNLLTANLGINLGRFSGNRALTPVTISLYADNLLDEEIYFPSVNRRAVNSLPHHTERGFYGTVQIDF